MTTPRLIWLLALCSIASAEMRFNGLFTDNLGLQRELPAPGVHPRILFSPDDLPRIRARFTSDAAGTGMLAAYKESPEGDNPPGSGFRANTSGRVKFATAADGSPRL